MPSNFLNDSFACSLIGRCGRIISSSLISALKDILYKLSYECNLVTIQNSIRNYVLNNKKVPVIIFDEAHLLKIDNFYELQIITNFNMDSSDPALVILIGQPHLRERLLIPVLQSFNQRISLKYHLPALTKEETASYVHHHLALAGLKEPLFNQNALNAIYQNSGGIPRMINALCTKTMTLGAIEKKDALSEDEVFRATHEL